jgi:hypothetical protein
MSITCKTLPGKLATDPGGVADHMDLGNDSLAYALRDDNVIGADLRSLAGSA